MQHIPVLLNEVLEFLDPKPGENFVDCTINGGGHALAILKLIQPRGRLLGIDQDEEIIKKLKVRERLILVNDSFVNLKKIVKEYNFSPVYGVLLDLGLSSWHLKESGRGFTFKKDEPLIMRYSKNGLTAEMIVNDWPEEELIRIFKGYGEERFARQIARRIVQARIIKPIKTTFDLIEIIKKAIPKKFQHGRIHFATKIFQALRITVNDELKNLKEVLPQALEILTRRGRLVIISFHSLEDRIVKNFLRNKAKQDKLKILTKKPLTPSEEEVGMNPRSRSAKLRAAVKLA